MCTQVFLIEQKPTTTVDEFGQLQAIFESGSKEGDNEEDEDKEKEDEEGEEDEYEDEEELIDDNDYAETYFDNGEGDDDDDGDNEDAY